MCEGGGNCLKYIKGGGTKKEEEKTKTFKRTGKPDQEMGALKRGAGTPLRTMSSKRLSSLCHCVNKPRVYF